MCEILFRGFHKEENGKETIYIDGQAISGKWIYGCGVYNDDIMAFIINYDVDLIKETSKFEKIQVIPETIGQYLDETDSHGHKLFWNDEFVVPELNHRRIVLDNKLYFATIKNFIDNGTDFYYLKTIFDEEVK